MACALGAVSGTMSAAAGDFVVEVDHALLLRLPADASVVQIGNPAIAEISVASPRLIFLTGRAVGHTQILVLDSEDRALLSGDVLVTAASENTVNVYRGESSSVSVLLCAERCVVVDDAPAPPPSAATGSLGGFSVLF